MKDLVLRHGKEDGLGLNEDSSTGSALCKNYSHDRLSFSFLLSETEILTLPQRIKFSIESPPGLRASVVLTAHHTYLSCNALCFNYVYVHISKACCEVRQIVGTYFKC